MPLIKLLVVLMLIAIVVSLGSALLVLPCYNVHDMVCCPRKHLNAIRWI